MPAWFVPAPRMKPWGTVQAVLAARDAISGPFAAVNADDFYGAAAYRLAMRACEDADRDRTAAVIGLPLHRTLSEHGPVVRGICQLDAGWLTVLDEVYAIERIGEGARGTSAGAPRLLTGRELASMNFWVFAPAAFAGLEERFEAFLRQRGHEPAAELPLPEAVNEMLQAGPLRVRAIEAPGPWFGLTHMDDRPRASAGLRALHERGEYPDPLWRP